MSRLLGRTLLPKEFVHHVNGNHNDNRLENLRVVTPSEHARLHPRPKHRRPSQLPETEEPQVVYICQGCKQFYAVPPRSRRRYCKTCDLQRRRDGWKHRKEKGLKAHEAT